MSFNLEKLLSQLAILTHMVKNIRRTIERLGSDSVNPYLTIHCKTSIAVKFSPPIT